MAKFIVDNLLMGRVTRQSCILDAKEIKPTLDRCLRLLAMLEGNQSAITSTYLNPFRSIVATSKNPALAKSENYVKFS